MGYALLNVACAPGRAFAREPRTAHYRPSFNCYRCADGVWLQLLGLDWARHLRPLTRALGLAAETLPVGPSYALPAAEARACADDAERAARTIVRFDAAFGARPAAHWEGALRAEQHGENCRSSPRPRRRSMAPHACSAARGRPLS